MDQIKHANFSTHKREENFSSVRCIEVFNAMFPDSKEETALSASNFISSLHMLQKPIAFNVAYIDGRVSLFFMTSKEQTIAVDDAVFSSYLYSETKHLYEQDEANNLIKDDNPIVQSKLNDVIHLHPIINNIAYQYLVLKDFTEMDPLANLTNAVFNPKNRDGLIQVLFEGISDVSWRAIIERFEKQKVVDPYNAGIARFLLPGLFGYDTMGKASLPPTVQKDLVNISFKKSSIGFKVAFSVASEEKKFAKDLANVFSVFAGVNYFKMSESTGGKQEILNLDRLNKQTGFLISNTDIFMTREELASIVHLPTNKVRTPTMGTTSVRVLTIPPENRDGIRICDAYLRGRTYPIKVTEEDLSTHYTVLGSTGTGKTTFLENMADAFLEKGYGFAVVDPQDARLIQRIVALIKNKHSEREKDIIWFNPFNDKKVITLNPLNPWDDFNPQSLSGLLTNSFYRVWRTSWGPRLEWLLHLALLATTSLNRLNQDARNKGEKIEEFYTLRDIFYLYLDQEEFEKMNNKLGSYSDLAEIAKDFKEAISFLKTGRQWTDVVSPILNKLGIFDLNKGIRNAINSPNSSIDLRDIIRGKREKKILLIDLKTKEAKDIARVIGNVLVSLIYQALQETVEDRQKDNKGLYGLLLDEVHNFAGEALTNMIQEGRQIGVSIAGVTQFIDSFLTDSPEETQTMKSAFLSVPKNFIQFGTNSVSRDILEKFGKDNFTPSDFARMPTFLAYAILSINNRPEGPMVIQVKPMSKPDDKTKPENIEEENFQFQPPDKKHPYYIDVKFLEAERERIEAEKLQAKCLHQSEEIMKFLDALESKSLSIPNLSEEIKSIFSIIRADMISGDMFWDIHLWSDIADKLANFDFEGEYIGELDENDAVISNYISNENTSQKKNILKKLSGWLIGKITGKKSNGEPTEKTSIASPALWHGIKTTLGPPTKYETQEDGTKIKIPTGEKSIYDKIKEVMIPVGEIRSKERELRQRTLQSHYMLGEEESKLKSNLDQYQK